MNLPDHEACWSRISLPSCSATKLCKARNKLKKWVWKYMLNLCKTLKHNTDAKLPDYQFFGTHAKMSQWHGDHQVVWLPILHESNESHSPLEPINRQLQCKDPGSVQRNMLPGAIRHNDALIIYFQKLIS